MCTCIVTSCDDEKSLLSSSIPLIIINSLRPHYVLGFDKIVIHARVGYFLKNNKSLQNITKSTPIVALYSLENSSSTNLEIKFDLPTFSNPTMRILNSWALVIIKYNFIKLIFRIWCGITILRLNLIRLGIIILVFFFSLLFRGGYLILFCNS